MAALASPKHERFCQNIFTGMPAGRAYEEAGFSPDPTAGNARRMLGKEYVARRIEELRAVVAQENNLSAARILSEKSKIAFHNPADYLSFNEDGTAELDLVALDRDHCAAISEITCVTTYNRNGGKSTRVSIKLYDKNSALTDLGKHLGLWTEKVEIGRPGDFAQAQSTEELLAKVRAELGESDAEEFKKLIAQGDSRAMEAEAVVSSADPVHVD